MNEKMLQKAHLAEGWEEFLGCNSSDMSAVSTAPPDRLYRCSLSQYHAVQRVPTATAAYDSWMGDLDREIFDVSRVRSHT
eukprot:s49_g18.t1